MTLPSQPPRFQFSLRWLLIAITVVAVVLGLWPILGTPVTWIVTLALYVAWPTPLVLIAIFARREPQAFAIGALVPCLGVLRGAIPLNYPIPGAPTWWAGVSLFLILLTSVVCGVIGVATRRWIARKGWDQSE